MRTISCESTPGEGTRVPDFQEDLATRNTRLAGVERRTEAPGR